MDSWLALAERAERRHAPCVLVGPDRYDALVVWSGVARWVQAFRDAGLEPGSRLAVACRPGVEAAQVIFAAMLAGLTVVPSVPAADQRILGEAVDVAAAVVGADGLSGAVPEWAWVVEGPVGPSLTPTIRRETRFGPTPDARALVPGSAQGTILALSDRNLRTTVDTVISTLAPTDGRWLSVLPWYRADGLALDLLPGLLGAAELARVPSDDPTGLVGPAALGQAVDRLQATHLVAELPVVAMVIAAHGGAGPLAHLSDGMATGPGLTPTLAAALSKTRLRTQRGAPELSAMVTVGERGLWRVGSVGRPAGCTIERNPAGGMLVQGPNAAYGAWTDDGLVTGEPTRLVQVDFA